MKRKIMKRALEKLMSNDPVRFHMPGHKGKYYYDITEIPGADNLQQPEGIIREVEEKIATIYGAHYSYMLVGGSTLGIETSILSCCHRGDKILIPSNSHRSVLSAVFLGGLEPVIYQLREEEVGYTVDISILEEKLSQNPDVKAVVVVSPDYFGNISDLGKIRRLVKNKILILDQAHGAHLHFLPERLDGLSAGADYVIESTHKILGAPTQGAVLHVGSRVDKSRVRRTLSLLQTSSPSYLLLSGIEEAIDEANERAREVFLEIYNVYDKIQKHFKDRSIKLISPSSVFDKSKFIFRAKDCKHLEDILINQYRIIPELAIKDYLLMMTGIGTKPVDLERLTEALDSLSSSEDLTIPPTKKSPTFNYKMPYDEVVQSSSVVRELEKAEGRIATEFIVPFPPCIPILIPGSKITREHIDYLTHADSEEIQGLIKKNNKLYIETL